MSTAKDEVDRWKAQLRAHRNYIYAERSFSDELAAYHEARARLDALFAERRKYEELERAGQLSLLPAADLDR